MFLVHKLCFAINDIKKKIRSDNHKMKTNHILKFLKLQNISHHFTSKIKEEIRLRFVLVTLKKTSGKSIYMHYSFNYSLRHFMLQAQLGRDM